MHKKILFWMMFVLVVINLAIVAVVVFGGRAADREIILPDPNGYADFVNAGGLVRIPPGDPSDMSREELREFVTENSEALKLARVGLDRESRVPIEFSTEAAARHMNEFAALTSLARVFIAEAKLAEAEGRTNDAARVWVDLIQFGQEIARGGLMIDGLVAMNFETKGAVELNLIAGALNVETARESLSRLRKLESKRESAESIETREREWARRTGGLRGAFLQFVSVFSGDRLKPGIQNFQNFLAIDKEVQRQLRLLNLKMESRIHDE